jgi:hypothetical protein
MLLTLFKVFFILFKTFFFKYQYQFNINEVNEVLYVIGQPLNLTYTSHLTKLFKFFVKLKQFFFIKKDEEKK